ncbi:phage tail tape measure protein [Sporosarcina soli]|uniref:Phage tail tape measure protein n=1 Tax=Sporosarcina soli TaxID=334736 RepID=A0ABW0TDV0_9BACL
MLQDLFELVGRIRVDTTGLDSALQQAKSRVESVGKSFSSVGQKVSDVGDTMTKKVTLPFVAIGTAALHSAVSFESAFAGVRKTVDATEEEFGEFRNTILEMSKRLPATANEIAAVFEMGGQLGIAQNSLESFAGTIIDLGESTDLSLEQAATSFARFANIVGMSQDDFDRLGSSVVALGNTMATTESEIVGMSMRLAAQGAQVGMTEHEILALSATMSSLGIQAEMGGTAMTTILKKLQRAAMDGGAALGTWAEVAQMSSEEFKKLYNESAVDGLDAVVKGLNTISSRGENLTDVLEDMGIKGIYESDVLLRMSGASDLLGESLKTSADGWEKNKALSTEAGERYATTESQLRMLKNEVTAVAIQFGEIMIPILLDLVRAIKPIVDWFGSLSDETRKTIVVIAGLAVVIGPILIFLGSLIGSIGNIINLFATFIGVGGKVVGLFTRFGSTITRITGFAGKLFGATSRGTGVFARFLPMLGRFAAMIPRLLNPIGLAISVFLVAWNLMLKALGISTGEAFVLLGRAIKDAGSAIGGWLMNLGGTIVEGLENLLSWAGDLFSDFIESTVGAISKFITVAQGLWDSVINMIIDFIVNAVALIIGFVIDVIAQFVNLSNETKRIFNLILTTVAKTLGDMVRNAFQAAKNFVRAIVGGFQNAWKGALEFVGKASTLGVDFAKGIAKGITSGAKYLKNAIVGIGKAALNSFTDFFKIKSPSRVMEDEAKWLPAGIAAGIVKNVSKVGNAMGVVGGVVKRSYKNAMEGLSTLSIPNAANILPTPRRIEFAGVPQNETRRRRGEESEGGTVNVHVRKLEDASTQTIQNKVERRFFSKARQRE